MKKLFVLALTILSLNAFAQEKKEHKNERKAELSEIRKQMTPDEMTALRIKKMTLQLDLTEEQQKTLYPIFLKEAKERKDRHNNKVDKKEKLSKDDFVALKNQKLDHQIALKEKLKTILTPEQFEKLGKMKRNKKKGMPKRNQ